MAQLWASARQGLAAVLAGLALTASSAETAAVLADFERQHAVGSWPRLRACGYDRAWTGVAGTVLTVQTSPDAGPVRASGETALRKGLTCHVAVRHRLENWPADLPSGTYVVAATAHESNQFLARPWRLTIVAVARGLTSQQAAAAARQIDARQD